MQGVSISICCYGFKVSPDLRNLKFGIGAGNGVLDCGGKRSATPLSRAQNLPRINAHGACRIRAQCALLHCTIHPGAVLRNPVAVGRRRMLPLTERILGCGGKRRTMPLSHAQKFPCPPSPIARSKAVSRLPPCLPPKFLAAADPRNFRTGTDATAVGIVCAPKKPLSIRPASSS